MSQSGTYGGSISSQGIHGGSISSQGTHGGYLSSTPPDPDHLWKIRPVISAVVAACRTLYRPNREISIDEAMIAFKGRSLMKQYLPKKPIKRGFKVWVRADSHNGYISQFECYTGKKGDTAEVGLGGNVVIRLTRDLVGKTTTFTWTTSFHLCLYIKAYYSIKYTPREHFVPIAGISLLNSSH